MANSNFIVQNGIQIGPLTIDAATGSISTSGNITTTGTTTTFINEIVTGTEAVYGVLSANSGVASTSTTTGALIITGGAGISGALYAGSLYDSGTRVLSTSTGAGNLAISGTAVTLTATGTAGTNGSSTAIPTITTDAYGRVTAVTTNAVVAPAGTLTGSTLASGVTASSLTSLGTIASLVATNSTTTTGVVTNFSTGNAQITGGSLTGMNGQFATLTATNFSSANIASSNGQYTTLTATNLSSGNLRVSGTITPSANATIDIGSTSAWFANFYGVSTQAKYADLAENYQADKAYQAGQVLEFGGAQEVTLAYPDTKRVAGVVSTNPAHLMNGGLVGSNVVPVAFTGRVPCNVIGPIAKGDLMVSAGFGYAKTNNDAQVGQVIGKALADFTGAKGQIEVVVGRF